MKYLNPTLYMAAWINYYTIDKQLKEDDELSSSSSSSSSSVLVVDEQDNIEGASS